MPLALPLAVRTALGPVGVGPPGTMAFEQLYSGHEPNRAAWDSEGVAVFKIEKAVSSAYYSCRLFLSFLFFLFFPLSFHFV